MKARADIWKTWVSINMEQIHTQYTRKPALKQQINFCPQSTKLPINTTHLHVSDGISVAETILL